MSDADRTPAGELAGAAIFVVGCCGLCGMLTWLGPDGFTLGYAMYTLGWIVAMEVEDRCPSGRPRVSPGTGK